MRIRLSVRGPLTLAVLLRATVLSPGQDAPDPEIRGDPLQIARSGELRGYVSSGEAPRHGH